jgi:hypothetical protein
MVIKTLLIVLVFVVLMEDTASIRKTEEERKEDEEVAKAVNRTLAEEEKKRKEEEDEKKKSTEDDSKSKKEDKAEKKNVNGKMDQQESQNEAGPSLNCTCPVVRPCKPCQDCPKEKVCPEFKECPAQEVCPEVDPCQPCGPCPPIHCQPCPVCNGTLVDRPGVANVTRLDCPSEPASPVMTVPVAMFVGACASLLVIGFATAIGLLLRYVSPTVSGFLFLAVIIIIWYLSSQYPETARELGGRVVATLREATIALSHRVMEAIRHQEQVGFSYSPINPIFCVEFHVHLKSLY